MSMPFLNQEFTFTRRDGTTYKVRGTGNQNHAVFETEDGKRLVVEPHGSERESLSLEALELGAGLSRQDNPYFGKTRWQQRIERRRAAAADIRATELELHVAVRKPVIGPYIGLCLPIEFPRVSRTVSQADIEAFCNSPGYTKFGNHGSVRDYFFDVSGGRLTYTNVVAPYYTALHERDYYTDPEQTYGLRAQELIREALAHHKAAGMSFASLTADSDGYVQAINVLYAGRRVNVWNKGLWPHSGSLQNTFALQPGKTAHDYQITDSPAELTLATFCHENGHMICDFPDLYDYDKDTPSWGAGFYCLMGYGGTIDARKPSDICAYLKNLAGWRSMIVELTPHSGIVSLRAGRNEFAIRHRSASEYYIVENRLRAGRDSVLTDSGLAVWHVDENKHGDSEQEMTPARHYECSLIQADGKCELEKNVNGGNPGDLFKAGGNGRLSDTTVPPMKWWDGSSAGLVIKDVGAPGATMTFTVE